MDNLHRKLAPISDVAWQEIEEEARRTFIRNIAGRRIVDMPPAAGPTFAALGTGRTRPFDSGLDGVQARSRTSLPVMELRVPFSVQRREVDDVQRGAVDADWQPVKDAATQMAAAEDRTVFYGATDLGLGGIATSSSNEAIRISDDISALPQAVASALTQLRLVGVDGPYNLALSAELYTQVNETTDHGYPALEHIQRVVRDGKIIWAPALQGALLLSERGGDYELHLGQDLSIGYQSHDAESIQLYLEESFAFKVASDEAGVQLIP